MKMDNISINMTRAWIALSLTLMAGPAVAVSSPFKTATQAMNCQPDGPANCPYPFDLYETDPTYKKDMNAALKAAGHADLIGPNGLLDGPAAPMEPVTLAGKIGLRSSLCANGDCGRHNLTFIYQPTEHRVVGYYQHDVSEGAGDSKWIGQPTVEEAAALAAKNDSIKPVQTEGVAVQNGSQSGAPAGTVWEFAGDNGKTLWGVCGGSSSTCSIVANTKYYVAVMNHTSARGCAFGDFYIVARHTTSWQQYDTGTCSPDAYIQKGTISRGQYLSVDISVNGVLVKQYPIGYWSMQKEFSGSNRPSWDKAKANAKKSQQ